MDLSERGLLEFPDLLGGGIAYDGTRAPRNCTAAAERPFYTASNLLGVDMGFALLGDVALVLTRQSCTRRSRW